MPYIYLFSAVLFSSMLSIMGAVFNAKTECAKNSSALYNLFVTAAAFISWGIIFLADFEFEPKVLLYSFGYAIFYTMALMGLFGALKSGSVALTSFVKQLSLVGVAVWGFLFWNTPLSINVAIGIAIIVAAIYFCFKPDKKDSKTFSLRWLLNALILFIGNSGCTVIQKYQQMHFGGKYGSLLMLCACGFSAAVCFVMCLKKGKVSGIKPKAVIFPVTAGVSSALLNLFIIQLSSTNLSPALIYPTIAVGGVMLTAVFSVAVFREKLKTHQWIGLCIGMVAIAFLNLD